MTTKSMTLTFTFKKWMGLALLAVALLCVSYMLMQTYPETTQLSGNCVLSSGGSWICAKAGDAQSFSQVWHAVFSIVSGIGGTILTIITACEWYKTK